MLLNQKSLIYSDMQYVLSGHFHITYLAVKGK